MTPTERILDWADRQFPRYREIALALHAAPETACHEVFACETLSRQLAEEGFEVRTGVAGYPTAFMGVWRSGRPGPVLAFLAEYDALPGIGHACGHNLFGPTSVLAAACLRRAAEGLGGEIRVYGTPAEEGGDNGMAKIAFVREGCFRDVDAALCVHPGSDGHELTHPEIACAPVRVVFTGRPSHAASAPWEGVNALDALILVFNAVALLRQQLTPDVRVHGVVTDGGAAPNVIPERTEASFYVRAATVERLRGVLDKFRRIVDGAALQTGCAGTLELTCGGFAENIVPTPSFDEIYRQKLIWLGEAFDPDRITKLGSSDVGNVSQILPVIQPMIRISDVPVAGHTVAKREAAASETGLRSIAVGAKALALTALDLLEQPGLLERIREDHARAVAEQGAHELRGAVWE